MRRYKVHPTNPIKKPNSLPQKTLSVIVTMLALGGYNRNVMFNRKPKIYRYIYKFYCSILPSIYAYNFITNTTNVPFNINYSPNAIMVSIEILTDWLFTNVKGTIKLAVVYQNLRFLESKLAHRIKTFKLRNFAIMIYFLINHIVISYDLFWWIFDKYNDVTPDLIINTFFICSMMFVFNLDKVWLYYVFNVIRSTLEATYKEIKYYNQRHDKSFVLGNLRPDCSAIRLEELLVYYKKNVKAQEVMVWIMNPMYIFTVFMTLARVGTDLFFKVRSISSKETSATTTIMELIPSFISRPQIELWLILMLCFEGDEISKLDQKITMLLTDMLVDGKESLSGLRTIETFLRYIERKHDKLTTCGIIRLTVELPLFCCWYLIQFFVLLMQFLNIAYVKENIS